MFCEYRVFVTINGTKVRLNPCCNGICSVRQRLPTSCPSAVLILVVMEYVLWAHSRWKDGEESHVLILVVMEYVLWAGMAFTCTGYGTNVLILVVMEYVLWAFLSVVLRWSRFVLILVVMEYVLWEQGVALQSRSKGVLILVVMEYVLWVCGIGWKYEIVNRLNPCCNGICSVSYENVNNNFSIFSLNPCCNGICSVRIWRFSN